MNNRTLLLKVVYQNVSRVFEKAVKCTYADRNLVGFTMHARTFY